MKNICTLLSCILLGTSCATSRLPPPLSDADRTRIKPIDLCVGIEPYRFPVYSEDLKAELRKTKMFKSVELKGDISSKPEVVAYVGRPVYGTPTFPIAFLLTFGIIPSKVVEEHGWVISFANPDAPQRRVHVEFTYESTSVLGWAALFMNLSPNWSFKPERSRRYLDGFALAISTNAQAIHDLTME